MNYLGHMFLSGDDPELMMGNFIADAVKGNKIDDFPESVRRGILLHRKIDTFTDSHPSSRALSQFLNPYFRKYSGVVVDMYYDHFLARNWENFSQEDIRVFTERNYLFLHSRIQELPPKSKRILPFMMEDNWLMAYASFGGLDKAFRGMARRTPFFSGMEKGVAVLRDHYAECKLHFDCFMPEVIAFVAQEKEKLS